MDISIGGGEGRKERRRRRRRDWRETHRQHGSDPALPDLGVEADDSAPGILEDREEEP